MAPRTSTQVINAPPLAVPGGPGHGAEQGPKKKAAKGWNPTTLTWSENYSEGMEKAWAQVPGTLKKVVVTLAVFTMGLAMSGDWLVILVHLRRQLGLSTVPDEGLPTATTLRVFLETRFKDFGSFWIWSTIVSYGLYFGIGGFLHWYFYVRQRESAKEWKCQPNSWLSTDLELHEIKVGSLSLLVTGTFSSILACWIANGGWSSVYYEWDAYGAAWFFLQVPVIFIYQDYVTYLLHRAYHTPWLYKHFHKLHHTYKHPTAFSVTAIHPVEVLHIQMTLCLPLFAFPVHWAPFYAIVMYTYYHGIIDHSGINFKAHWWQPWQPDAIFHDNHHQYFHVNFGFNCWMWDKDRVYTEETFYGRGKAVAEATQEEIAQDMKERTSENPKAYRNEHMEFALSAEDVKSMKQKSN
ncbi:hypothetical protein FOCC_FOCC008785 [Frankliniella occidentalis]|nr:hypothetical protein FOCC_FOCC008785 [Frankliniella occidentalis]